LYFSLRFGFESRVYTDYAVDALCLLCLAFLLWLPCCLYKRRNIKSFCRLFIVYLAAIPSLSLSKLIHMFRGEEIFLWDGSVTQGILQWFWDSAEALQIWLPLLILLYAIEDSVPKWHRIVWMVQVFLLTVSLMVPASRHLIGYAEGYLGVLLAFDLWEKILEKNKKLEKWSGFLFVILLLRAVYRIMIIMSKI